jgi:hypothetical protein
MSFLNVVKYPPSLLYLMMTLGPSIALLAFFERLAGPVGRFFTVYGRVPMFYYIVHLYVIHGLVLVLAGAQGLPVGTFFNLFFAYPRGWGYSLPVVYLIWMGVVLALYAPCRWFAGVKRRSRAWWISYI